MASNYRAKIKPLKEDSLDDIIPHGHNDYYDALVNFFKEQGVGTRISYTSSGGEICRFDNNPYSIVIVKNYQGKYTLLDRVEMYGDGDTTLWTKRGGLYYKNVPIEDVWVLDWDKYVNCNGDILSADEVDALYENAKPKVKSIKEGIFNNNYDYKYTPADRSYVQDIRNNHRLEGIMISMKFLDIIGVSDELKNKFREFEATYGRMPKFAYGTSLAGKNSKVDFQKVCNHKRCDGFFTEEDKNEIVNKWIETYNAVKAEDDIYKETPEAVVRNVVDFVKDNKLAIGCAVFGVAALTGVIPAIVNKYKSEADIREAVEYFMNSVDWDENDRDKTIATTHTSFDSEGKVHTTTRARTLRGNKNTSKSIFTAVAKYAKKNGITVRDAFHKLDGQKAKGLFGETGEDFYSFDIVKDNNGVLTINVWNAAGRKPKTFEIDTNTYQRIGDATFVYNESKKKKANHVKESRVVNLNRTLRGHIISYIRNELPQIVGEPEAENFKTQQKDCDLVYTDVSYTGKIRFGINVVGDSYQMSATKDKGLSYIHWEGIGLDEFQTDFEDMIATIF